MPVEELAPVLDLKPLQYNPFADGTVVYDNAGGVLVPRSAGGSIAPLGENPLTAPRPSRASTEQLIDSARDVWGDRVTPNAAAPRGYQVSQGLYNTNESFNPERFSKELDNLSDKQLNDLVDDLIAQPSRAAAEAAAVKPRQLMQDAFRKGSNVAGALGLAMDAYNIADAIADPTNNPADEIGDFVGSTMGGALGAGLGPGGALAGSLLGGWLGRQLGNLAQGGGRRVNYEEPGEPPFYGGQENALYHLRITHYFYSHASNGSLPGTVNNPWQLRGPNYSPHPSRSPIRAQGPIRYRTVDETYGDYPDTRIMQGFELIDGNGNRIGGSTSNRTVYRYSTYHQTYIESPVPPSPPYLDNLDVTKVDGTEDTGGNPPGPGIPRVTPPFYSPTTTTPYNPVLPSPTGSPLPSPTGQPLPAPTGSPLPSPTGQPLPAPPGDPLGAPNGNVDSPPAPDNLPDPRPAPDTTPRPDPNPELDCCSTVLDVVDRISFKLESSGSGAINLQDCNSEDENGYTWEGKGLDGIYAGLEVVTNAIERIWTQVKCPPETTAATPMVWETKVAEHPQLIVLWGDMEGGSSRWAMHIPHPTSNVDESYKFRFPQYKKGTVRGSLVLSDNTRLVVNGASEAECKKVFSYCKNLIEKQFLDKSQEVFTKGSNNNRVVDVKAHYIKAFSGHRDQAPLWTKSL